MKILFLAPADSIHTYRWLSYFSDKYDLFLISETESRYDFKNVCLLYYGYKIIKLPDYLKQTRDFLREKVMEIKPDIIHVHFLERMGWIPGLVDFHPCIITLWGSDLFFPNLKESDYLLQDISKLCLSRSDLVTADSPLLLQKALSFGAKNTELILFGPDKKFCNLQKKEDLRRKYKISEDIFVILSLRALKPLYRIDKLVEMMEYLEKGNLLLLIDYNAYQPYKNNLLELINRKGLQEKIMIVSEHKHDQLNNLYNISDLSISIPQTDGVPASIFESMACEVPVLSVKLDSYQNIFSENENIFFVANPEPETLANKVEEIKNLKSNLIIKNALKLAKKYSFDEQMMKMDKIYQKIYDKFKL